MAENDHRYFMSQQVWGILALAACEGRTVTYEEVGGKIGRIPRTVGHYLDPIKAYCQYHNLPHLNALCVSKGRDGLPRDPAYGSEAAEILNTARAFDWSNHSASPRDLAVATELSELKNKSASSPTD